MANRDFLARGTNKKKKKNNGSGKFVVIGLAMIILIGFSAGLFLLKKQAPQSAVVELKTEKEKPKSQLPSPPEEVWSYIKALETRTVPITDDPASLSKNMRLTDEQRKVLAEMDKEQKAAEKARKLAEQKKEQDLLQNAESGNNATPPNSNLANNGQSSELARSTESVKVENVKKVEKKEITDNKKTEPAKTETAKKVESKPASSEKKFGLQCGAFKNRSQAENLQARLAMVGLNAKVNAGDDWNRVVIGPLGDRSAAQKAQSQAKSVENCVIIGM